MFYEQGESISFACGGPGTFTGDAEELMTINIEEFGPSLSCPGEPVAGELSGTLALF
jgi:hypothetical protein